MLVGGILGFPYLVLVVLVSVAVIGFAVRRKWRRAAARREEIRRLLVLASEEAARAELEATAGYFSAPASISPSTGISTSSKPQYQCAVCFCPTTTRCAKCKAVRYCSGKCQIIHWRQGHKDECRPFVTIQQSSDEGFSSGTGIETKQDGKEDHANGFDTEKSGYAKPAEIVQEKSSGPFVGLHCKDDVGVDSFGLGKGMHSSTKVYDGSSSSSILSDSCVDTSSSSSKDSDGPGGLLSDDEISINSVDQNRPNFSDGDTQSGSSSSPSRTADGSNESPSSETSMPHSGFWEGAIHSKKSRIDVLNDSDIPDSQSSLNFSFDLAKRDVHDIKVRGLNADSITSDDVGPSTLGFKKHIHEASLSEVVCKDGVKSVKSRGSTSYISGVSKHMNMDSGSNSQVHMSEEAKLSPFASTTSRQNSTAGRQSTPKVAKIVSSLPSSSIESSNQVFNNKSTTSNVSKSLDVKSSAPKTSDNHSSSCTRKHLVQTVKSLKVDDGISSQFAENLQYARNGLKTSMLKVVDQLKPSKLSRHYPSGAGSEMAGKSGIKALFSYELFVKLYHWKKVELRPCGLINCGNSCYANAVLQCLAFTPPLMAYLLEGLHSKSCSKKEWCFTCEFESLVLKAKDGNSPLSPIRILSQIQSIGSHLGIGKEEDAHEFLRYAIDILQSICLKEPGAHALCSLEEETTLVGLTFGGYLRSKIKCMKCGGKSERHERMMDLTVEIEGNIGTLEEALDKFTCTEILDGENKYECSRCKSYEKAKKKLTVLEAPNVLTIALKRFQSGKFGKLNKSIQFPEILDLAPYMSGTSDKSPIYMLYGVVVHLDTMNAAFSGHYVCYVKNVQNKWFKIDDSLVKEVELNVVLTKGAYMLLYARCSPRAPRSIRNSLIPRDPRKQKNPPLDQISHSIRPWDICRTDPSNDHLCSRPVHRNIEEDSLSSSSFFSESYCSTESSNRDSSSNDEYFDHIFGDLERDWSSSQWRNSSDSDTSSSSSFPSPLYSRRSPLSDSNRYSSGFPETSGSQVDYVESSCMDDHDIWSRARARSRSCKVESSGRKGSSPFLYSDMTKDCRKLGCSNSCRDTNSDRLGWVNPLENEKHGVSFRRSTRGRSD